MKKIFHLIFLLLPLNTFAAVFFNMTIIHKRGIDKGLVLSNEVHSQEIIFPKRMIRVFMNDTFRFEGMAISSWNLEETPENIIFEGEISFDRGIEEQGPYKKKLEFNLKINEPQIRRLVPAKGELIELTIQPFTR